MPLLGWIWMKPKKEAPVVTVKTHWKHMKTCDHRDRPPPMSLKWSRCAGSPQMGTAKNSSLVSRLVSMFGRDTCLKQFCKAALETWLWIHCVLLWTRIFHIVHKSAWLDSFHLPKMACRESIFTIFISWKTLKNLRALPALRTVKTSHTCRVVPEAA